MALIPDINTLKSLLRAYAAMDGYTPFKSDNPHVASRWVAPHADRYVESVRESVADKSLWARKFSAIWAGTARTAMMLPPGIVDFIGAVFKEGLARGVVRMAKEVLAGSVSITTRMANIMVGPASELPPFENVLTQTEWAWSVVLFMDGARSIMGRGTGGKWPMELDVRQPVATGVGRVADVNLQMPGILFKVSDADFVAALEKHGGNRTRVAKELGILHGSVSLRIIRAAEGTPLAKFKEITGRHGLALTISDADLAALLTLHNSSRTKAAEACGLERSSVSSRIMRASEDSPLSAYRMSSAKGKGRKVADTTLVDDRATPVSQPVLPARPPVPLAHVTDAAITEVLVAHRSNFLKAALQLKCTTRAIARRIELAEQGSPLRAYRNQRY